MMTSLKRWLEVLPEFANPVERRQAPAVQIFLLSIILAAILWMVGVALLISPSMALLITHTAALVIIAAHLLAWRLLRSGHFNRAVMLSALSLHLPALAVMALWGLENATGTMSALTVSLLIVGLLGSRRSLMLIAALNSIGVALIALVDIQGIPIFGRVSVPGNPHLINASIFVLCTGVMLILLLQFGHWLRRSLQAAFVRQQELEETRSVLTARTRELEQALKARREYEAHMIAMQKLESLGTLAGGIAHDFNNLLTIILGSVDEARIIVEPTHPVQDELQAVFHAAKRASTLTRHLLSFARKQPMQVQMVHINDLVQTMQILLERMLGASYSLVLKLDSTLPYVQADPGQLEQVVINLVLNARDAMPDGGTLILETSTVAVIRQDSDPMTELRPGTYSVFAVHDTGAGMDADTRARVFEPFFTTKPRGSGTGLGLAMCYGIATQHGGQIIISSTVGTGTSVQVFLPGVWGALDSPLATEAASQLLGNDVVLVADDEPALRQLVARVLRQHGYQAIEAENGKDALQILEKWAGPPIALLITDVVMPQMGGAALAEHIRQKTPTLQVIFMSGYTEEALVPNASARSTTHFLPKPFAPHDLLRLVRAVLDDTWCQSEREYGNVSPD